MIGLLTMHLKEQQQHLKYHSHNQNPQRPYRLCLHMNSLPKQGTDSTQDTLEAYSRTGTKPKPHNNSDYRNLTSTHFNHY